MTYLKEKLHDKIVEHRPRIKRLLTEYGEKVINEVSVQQVIGGMRGIKSLVTDISYLDPFEGIRYRGYTLKEVLKSYRNLKVAKCHTLRDYSIYSLPVICQQKVKFLM